MATWIAAFGSVVTFYAHALIGRPATQVTPMVAIAVTVSFVLLALFGLLTMRTVRAGTAARQASAAFLFAGVLLGSISTLVSLTRHNISIADWGVFIIQIITPVILTLCATRKELLQDICRIALFFALTDFALNFLSFVGVASLAKHVGENSDYGIHYLGLTGNSYAEGLVAFLSISYVAFTISRSRSLPSRAARYVLLAILLFSEWLIRARVDFGLSIVALCLLLLPWSVRLPMVLVAATMTVGFLFSSFYPNVYNTDETLRRDLLVAGAKSALHHPLFGEGVHYRATDLLQANYNQLHEAGITESGTLDFAISYGVPATICLYLSAFFALAATRIRQTLPVVLLVCLTGALAMTGGLASFLGSIVFYLALILCQRDEWWLLQSGSRQI